MAAAWALSLLPWTATSAKWFFGAWSLGIAVVAAFSLAGAVDTGNLSNYLFEFRYQHPVGYANGNAALGAVAALVAFGISSDRDLHPALSGLMMAAAALLADFTMLAQSRASAIGAMVGSGDLHGLRPRPPADRGAAGGARRGGGAGLGDAAGRLQHG